MKKKNIYVRYFIRYIIEFFITLKKFSLNFHFILFSRPKPDYMNNCNFTVGSYFTGPSVAYDCNWITGLEVIRLACRAIRNGECEAAIVGAVNLIYFPEIQMIFDELNFVSPDGSTRAFDENGE